jgi:hypothetical protein
MFFAKNWPNNNFQCSQAESQADRIIVQSTLDCLLPHVAVGPEDIDVLVLLMTLPPDDKELYHEEIMSYSEFIQRKQIKTSLLISKRGFFSLFMRSQDVILYRLFIKKGKNQFVKIFNYDNKLRAVAEISIKVKK